MNAGVDITNYVPYLIGLGGVGVGVVLFMEVLKRLFKLDNAHVIHLTVVIASILGAAAQYVIQAKSKLPLDILGVSAPTIYGVATFVYKESQYTKDLLSRIQIVDPSQAKAAQDDAAVNAVIAPEDIAPAEPSAAASEPEAAVPADTPNNLSL